MCDVIFTKLNYFTCSWPLRFLSSKKLFVVYKNSSQTVSKRDKNDLEPYLTSSPAKSNTLVMVTLAGSDALVSALKGATSNTEESS